MAADPRPGAAHGPVDCDVLVVGAGPVGLATALLLGRRGWRVTVIDRQATAYTQPRAVHFDHEVARLFADAGLADWIARCTEPADIYECHNAAGETLLHFDWTGLGPSGWPIASMFYQPALEGALTERAGTLGGLTVRRGQEVIDLARDAECVRVTVREESGRTYVTTAGWLIGCDGANSFVRTHLGIKTTDLGFSYDWLIVDAVLHERREWNPVNLQMCDPARPTTVVSGGPGRRRWEFMRMAGESADELNRAERAWQLLAPWGLTPDNCSLERHAIYTFQARWADTWRDGRVLLAGDSAHLMPPFAGQGMCSGIRDAANLSWKLDLVQRGLAAPALLDTYGPERSAHVQHAIGMSVEIGKVICVTDAGAAAERDAFMIGQGADPAKILPPLPPSTLTDGVLHRDAAGAVAPGAGVLTTQPRVTYRGRTGLLDEVLGTPGFLLACTADPATLLPAADRAFLDTIGTHVMHVVASGAAAAETGDTDVAVDLDGAYLPCFAEADSVAVLVRPDHYLFGAAATADEVPRLAADLRRQLGAAVAAAADVTLR
jgi:flavoprotein hydroxylase